MEQFQDIIAVNSAVVAGDVFGPVVVVPNDCPTCNDNDHAGFTYTYRDPEGVTLRCNACGSNFHVQYVMKRLERPSTHGKD